MNKKSKPDQVLDLEQVTEFLLCHRPDSPAVLRIVRTGSEESDQFVLEGTQSGLRQAAALLIRAGDSDVDESPYPPIDEMLFGLFDEKSDVILDDVIRLDTPDIASEPNKATLSGALGNIGCVTVLVSIPVFWFLGLYTLCRWLFA